ncbi:hypothetical protein KIN20_007634 [Parelaphostrongylus tenuis]|uniref:Uncharacterized protein n=1 Tax=Parelaphostrongylus tenuis TaxID=148309 RepID=A0AAD5MMH0_PARTN|nr:hypothetical protein KIN20_007634 [Parelaphostrongylus tenuis]
MTRQQSKSAPYSKLQFPKEKYPDMTMREICDIYFKAEFKDYGKLGKRARRKKL